MGVKKENDGRYSVGMGVQNGNEYKGSQGWRDIFIQLTADGATEDSIEKLEFLRDYAIYHSGEGNPVMPPSVNVWISNNGTTTAVEADDISYTDGVYTICGIKCSGDSWDFSNAGQGGCGGGLPAYTSADAGKVLTVGDRTEAVVVVPEQTVTTVQGAQFCYAAVDGSTIDWASAESGDSIKLTINGTEYVADYDAVSFGEPAFIALSGGAPVGAIANVGGTVTFLTTATGEYTIKATAEVPGATPVWGSVPSVRVIRATGVGIVDSQAKTVEVALDISWDEWNGLFAPETFRPAVIYAPIPDLYADPYWSYEYGGYTLWLRDSDDGFEQLTVGENTEINFYADEAPSIVYTIGGTQ